VPNEVLDFIAQKVPSNIRELEGALNRVRAYAELAKSPVTVEIAGLALHELIESSGKRAVAPDAVIRAVCRAMNVPRQDLGSKARDRRVLVPRQIAMYLLREETDLSLSEVGALFGGRDHSTVLHSCEKVATELEENARLRASVGSVREALANGA
jgi:chromosomal replication initiator protein